jgi:phosphopantothenoylcysteine decarboxylase / phosphopantothenate---cysteine ligase
MLRGRKILVGVTGGIAAYKTATIIRLLVKEEAEVKVVMTDHAKEFITPLTLATLSRNPVLTQFFNPENGDWNSHVDLGLWADLFLIAPATANTIAKMANGVADNLLLTSYLSARCPVFVAPSMDLDMLKHPATIINIETLKAFGNTILEPASGELASGLSGKGRMAEPDDIVKVLIEFLSKKKSFEALKGKKVLINAGPTQEAIDPVRFISNNSSGKMGIALARTAARSGAKVTLILGPSAEIADAGAYNVIRVTSAAEMATQTLKYFSACDIAILAAAVADYTPQHVHNSKLKKSGRSLTLKLVPTIDIALELSKIRRTDQIVAGFALETDNEIQNAGSKLKRKKFDLIILNSLNDKGAGFGHNTNRVTLIDKNNNIDKFELKSKDEVAADILGRIAGLLK